MGLLVATQDAVFDALNVAAVTDLAPVFQHVPENTQPPYIIVGDIESEADGGKGGPLDRQTIDIEFAHRNKGRRPLLVMMDAVRARLDGLSISTLETTFSKPRYLGAVTGAAEDGVTYGGVMTFEIYAEPA